MAILGGRITGGQRLPPGDDPPPGCERIIVVSEYILDELAWRGLIAQSTDLDALRHDLDGGPRAVYGGFDPTAPSLHVGHLVLLTTLRRFQLAGHRPIVLAGGATGLIGDPREVGERTLQKPEVVAEWTERISGQLARFVDLDGSFGAIQVNNLEWTSRMTAIGFLRDLGKHFSVNVMLSRDTIQRRLEGEGLSFAEFSYGLLQANDYLELHWRYGCILQLGGSDQWGNIVAGVDLIRRVMGRPTHALTYPLLTDTQGRKIGKSTGGGGMWLDPSLTSPYAWYQTFLNLEDAKVGEYLRLLTFLLREEIEELEAITRDRPQTRAAQRRLAEEMALRVHGPAETARVIAASQALFGRGELRELDAGTLDAALAEIPSATVRIVEAPTIVDLLVGAGLADSRGAARRTVAEGGAYVNNAKVTDEGWQPGASDLLHGRWLVVRRGKRQTAGVEVLPT
ncbi:MAG: tyrosine--tRNA ligase [Pseudonocardiales bacterium]|nr:tyrosine--tRNA ligase [Pseudonocardiales bacterium]